MAATFIPPPLTPPHKGEGTAGYTRSMKAMAPCGACTLPEVMK